jgi:hypothetical protein
MRGPGYLSPVASRTFRTDAIVLRTVDFAETSQVVHLVAVASRSGFTRSRRRERT